MHFQECPRSIDVKIHHARTSRYRHDRLILLMSVPFTVTLTVAPSVRMTVYLSVESHPHQPQGRGRLGC